MTEEQILKKLTKLAGEDGYHAKEWEKAQKQLSVYYGYTDEQWEDKMKRENKEREKSYQIGREKAKRIKEKHDKTRADLRKLIEAKGVSDITKNIARFGREQLNMCKDEEEYHHLPEYDDLHTDVKKYKKEVMGKAKRDVEYHQKEKKEERDKDRLKGFLQLKKDVEKVL